MVEQRWGFRGRKYDATFNPYPIPKITFHLNMIQRYLINPMIEDGTIQCFEDIVSCLIILDFHERVHAMIYRLGLAQERKIEGNERFCCEAENMLLHVLTNGKMYFSSEEYEGPKQ